MPQPALRTAGYQPLSSKESSNNDGKTISRWRGHWFCCCYKCSHEDVAGCCLAFSCPCVAYGWNVARVLGLSFWRELCKFTALVIISCLIDSEAKSQAKSACYPLPAANAAAGMLSPESSPACLTWMLLSRLTMVISFCCLIWWAWSVGGLHRRQMRQKLGIPASTPEGRCCSSWHRNDTDCNDDCCLHYWCLMCALAQETRTVMHLAAQGQLPCHQGADAAAAANAPVEVAGMQRSTAVATIGDDSLV